ncbi:MAG TPA: hypothetical protein DCG34_03845 [Clostridiales bacterium]|jgi:hypothetical protein|nr:hypothetical protein [Clostridiales bacterium]
MKKEEKKATIFMGDIKKIVELKEKHDQRKADALKKVEILNAKKAEINTKYCMEIDPDKIKDLTNMQRQLKSEIEDLEMVLDFNIAFLVKDMLDQVELKRIAAQEEYSKYTSDIDNEIKKVEEDAKKKVMELKGERRDHIYSQAYTLYQELYQNIIQEINRRS